MATITFSVTSTPATGSKSFTVSDAHVARWVAALKSKSLPTPTTAQALVAWADAEMETIKSTTLSYERDAAAEAVTPITAS